MVLTAVKTRSPANAKGCSGRRMDLYSAYAEADSVFTMRENIFPE